MCRNVWKASIPSHPVKAPSHCAGAEDEACQPIVHRAPCCQANGWHNQPKTKRWRILICSVLQKFQRSDYWISLGNVSEISQVIRWKSCSVLRISCRQAQKALLMKFKVWWLCGIFSLVFFGAKSRTSSWKTGWIKRLGKQVLCFFWHGFCWQPPVCTSWVIFSARCNVEPSKGKGGKSRLEEVEFVVQHFICRSHSISWRWRTDKQKLPG